MKFVWDPRLKENVEYFSNNKYSAKKKVLS